MSKVVHTYSAYILDTDNTSILYILVFIQKYEYVYLLKLSFIAMSLDHFALSK